MSKRPKVMMLGLRGVPQVQGGVEKHVEELARVFVEKGWDVEVLGRKPYLTQKSLISGRVCRSRRFGRRFPRNLKRLLIHFSECWWRQFDVLTSCIFMQSDRLC